MSRYYFTLSIFIFCFRITAQELTMGGVAIQKDEVPSSVLNAWSADFKGDSLEEWQIIMPHSPTIKSGVTYKATPAPTKRTIRAISRRARHDARMNARKEDLISRREKTTDPKERLKLHAELQKLASKNAWKVEPIALPKKAVKSNAAAKTASPSNNRLQNTSRDLTTDAEGLLPSHSDIVFAGRNIKLPQYLGIRGEDYFIYDIHGNLVYSQKRIADTLSLPQPVREGFAHSYPAYENYTAYAVYAGPRENKAKSPIYKMQILLGNAEKSYYYKPDGSEVKANTAGVKSQESR